MANSTNLNGSKKTAGPDGSLSEKRSRISLDAWAVTLALGLALLIWSGVIKHVPW